MAIVLVSSDVLRVRLVCQQADQVSFNILHYAITLLTGLPTDGDVAFALNTLIRPIMSGWMSVNARYYGIGVQINNVLPIPPRPEASVVQPVPGEASGGTLPTQCCGLIRLKPTVGGRGRDGRIFVPFMSNSFQVPATSTVNDTGVAQLQLLADTIFAPGEIVGLAGTVQLIQCLAWTPGNVRPVTATIAQRGIATQKSRGFYGKKNFLPF